MNMERKFIRLLSALFIGLFVICSLKIDSLAFSGGYGVRITGSNQAVDSIEMNGRVIQAIYRPYDGTNGTDTTYSCAAFVKRFYRDAYGIDVYNLSSITSTPLILSGGGNFSLTSSPKKGDIVRDNKSTHWAIVKSVEADGKIYVIQQNAWLSNRTEAWVGAYTSVSDSNYSFFTYSGSGSGSTDTEPPVISNVAITNVTNTGYTVTCTVTDNTGVSKVEFPTWKASDTSVGCTWYRGTQHGSTYTFTFQGADRDGNYLTHIYAFDSAGNSSSIGLEEVYIDRIPPVISDVSPISLNGCSYRITCTATDNVGIDRVQFPTWTMLNGMDDIMPNYQDNPLLTGEKIGNSYVFTVKSEDHNYENGEYQTDIYAYDLAGNYTVFGMRWILSGDMEVPKILEVKILEITGNSYTLSCTASDNEGISRVQFPTWTVANGMDDLMPNYQDNPLLTGEKIGNSYVFTVKSEDHNHENGEYRTDIYVFDTSNNWSVAHISTSLYPLESIAFDVINADISVGESFTPIITYQPANTSEEKNVVWKSSDPFVANVENGIITGYKQGTAIITAEVGGKIANCTVVVKEENNFESFPFSDITQNPADWKYESVKYVYDHKIMNGISNTDLFKPDHFLTRSMFATVLYRMAGEPPVTFKKLFSDVDDGRWYSNAIVWANEQKIVSGYSDGRYGINNNITREQIAKMLYEYAKNCGNDVSIGNELGGFIDSSIVSDWAVGYMKWATAVGMITGKPNGNGSFRLDPKGQATRAECAKMITMFMKMYGE